MIFFHTTIDSADQLKQITSKNIKEVDIAPLFCQDG